MALLLSLTMTACSDDDEEELVGNWTKYDTFTGAPRSGAVVFVINEEVYMGLGYNSEETKRYQDFYKYNVNKKEWTKLKDFPGVGRNKAVAFAVDGKGVVGSGFDGKNKCKDFWVYNPATDEWTETNEFPGDARYGAVAFAIGDKGYVGTGYTEDGAKKDFYQFNPADNSWVAIPEIPGDKRRDATAFVINDKAYVVCGSNNSTVSKQLYVFDPSLLGGTGSPWTEKRKIYNVSDESYDDDYSTIIGTNKVSFVMGGLGYVTTGGSGTPGKITWEYNPLTDLWTERTNFEGVARNEAIAFTVGDKGYVGLGKTSSLDLDDIFVFDPTAEVDENDND
ncbi:galactose oxidase-like protein [Breznakibacter xylanolyticus]|uniref:Galactose oxidase-like protein n=1 Tax=Breznakibacter xylanolyticus TaxID=990 RepID=A0A2W7NJD7_9BACT|nr:kelch repeat-containing protein [Breznakibacter xylanolyticus]PZX20368.1 galactose oxidase-like protein [Breznakibacter xylanolyticus]